MRDIDLDHDLATVWPEHAGAQDSAPEVHGEPTEAWTVCHAAAGRIVR